MDTSRVIPCFRENDPVQYSDGAEQFAPFKILGG